MKHLRNYWQLCIEYIMINSWPEEDRIDPFFTIAASISFKTVFNSLIER